MLRSCVSFTLILCGSAALFAQAEKDTKAAAATRTKRLQAKVSVAFDDTPFKECLEDLKSQVEAAGGGNVSFKLEPGVSMNQKVTYSAKDKTVAVVLDAIFQKLGLGYYVVSKEKDRYDGWIVIKPGKERGYAEGHEPAKEVEKAAGKEKPTEKAASKTKSAAKEKPAEEGDKNEQDAARKLRLATDLADAGKTDRARERYQDIIKHYPKTKAAAEAKELLDKLKK